MAIKSNAYNFSNDLQRIGSSLANAMIGNAQDDAAIARAGYYDAQTVGQNQDNVAQQQLFDAGAALASTPQFQSVIAQAMGMDTIGPNFMGPPSPTGIRTGTPAANNLARTFLGEYGNAQTMANAAAAYGDAGASRMFEAMIAGGDDDAMRRGFIGLGNNPTKYFDRGTAQTEIANDLRVGLDKNEKALLGDMYSAETTLEAALNEDSARFGPGGLGDRSSVRDNETAVTLGEGETAAKERWERYKSDNALKASKYETDVDAGVTRSKNEMADKLARWKHENRTIEMSVEPGKVIVLDPVSGKKLGLKPVESGEYKGLYILDGGKKPGDVTVTVGRGDVYLDQATAEALGIPKVNGKYVIKGAGFKDDASTRSTSTGDITISASDDNAMRDYVALVDKDGVLKDMPNGGLIVDSLIQRAIAAMGSKKNISNAKQFIRQELSKGFTQVVVPDTASVTSLGRDTRIQVPNFALNALRDKLPGDDKQAAFTGLKPASQQQIRGIFTNLGYSDAEVNAIIGAL